MPTVQRLLTLDMCFAWQPLYFRCTAKSINQEPWIPEPWPHNFIASGGADTKSRPAAPRLQKTVWSSMTCSGMFTSELWSSGFQLRQYRLPRRSPLPFLFPWTGFLSCLTWSPVWSSRLQPTVMWWDSIYHHFGHQDIVCSTALRYSSMQPRTARIGQKAIVIWATGF